MPLKIELQAADAGPGYATLTAGGWRSEAPPIEFSVQRNQDGRYLGEDGGWTTNQVWHGTDLALVAGAVSGEMGPWLVDPLVRDPTHTYLMELRSADLADKGVLRMRGQILSSEAAGNSVSGNLRAQHDKVPPLKRSPDLGKPEVPPASIDPDPAPAPVAPTPPARTQAPTQLPGGAGRGKLIALAAVALLVLAAAFWFLTKQDLETAPPVPPATAADSGAGTAVPCTAEALERTEDDLAFVQACVRSTPSTETVLAIIETAKQAGRCDVVQRLYAHQAQSGDARIALAYAKEYDPEGFKEGGCIKAADAETASYWYETVLAKDGSNEEAKKRLEQLRK